MSKPTFSFHDEPVAWLYEPYLGPSLWGDHHDGMWGAPRLSFDQPYSTDRNITPLYARSMRLVPDQITGQSDAREFPPLPDAPGAEFAAASSAIEELTTRAETAERYHRDMHSWRNRALAAECRAEKNERDLAVAHGLLREARDTLETRTTYGIRSTIARIDAALAVITVPCQDQEET